MYMYMNVHVHTHALNALYVTMSPLLRHGKVLKDAIIQCLIYQNVRQKALKCERSI